MKICILSNSHIASLKQATDCTQPQTWVPTYFGAGKTVLGDMTLSKDATALVPTSVEAKRAIGKTSGQDQVIFDHYDAFFLYGLTAKTQTALNTFQKYQVFEHHVDSRASLVSEDVFRLAVRSQFSRTPAAKLLSLVARSGKPVVFSPAPFPSEVLVDLPEYSWLNSSEGSAAMLWINTLCEGLYKDMADAVGATLLLQPRETISSRGLTLREYGYGAKRLNGSAYDDAVDAHHMNARFGQIILNGAIRLFQQNS